MTVVWRRSDAAPGRRASGVALVVATLALVPVGSCSSDARSQPATQTAAAPITAGEAPVRVELIRDAVAAVEAELGEPQRFFEVNATPTLVNLFVAAENATQAIAYVYIAGALEQPAAPQVASGPTFVAADIDFDETLVLAQVRSQLASSDFRLFTITALEGGGVQYRTVVNSTQGTQFVVFLGGDGAILGTDQNLGDADS